MLDIDGTLIPYIFTALPSPTVKRAIKKAQKNVVICLVTGRSYAFVRHLLEDLNMHSGYAVVNNGANVVNIKTEELLYDQPIEKTDAEEVLQTLRKNNFSFYVKDEYDSKAYSEGIFSTDQKLQKAYMFFAIEEYSSETIDNLFNQLSHIPHLTLHKTHNQDPKKFGFNISHVNATKLQGIEAIMKSLHLKQNEVIGVGDSYNDFPLLMACGLKVAMGNAIEDLKAIADYIAPSVEEDGVADVIEKFIL